jgi:hypothetical protein
MSSELLPGTTKCQFCPKTFKTSEKASEIANANVWLSCYDCRIRIPKWIALRRRMKCKTFKMDKTKCLIKHSCQFCDEKFDHKLNLSSHCRLKHPNDVKNSWLKCQRCPRRYMDKSLLNKHKVKCGKSKKGKKERFKCKFCGLQTKTTQGFVKHVRTKHPEDLRNSWIKCFHCDLHFPDWKSMEVHFTNLCSQQMNVENQNYSWQSDSAAQSDPLSQSDPLAALISDNSAQMSNTAEASEVQCHFCCQSFANWAKMYKHTEQYHLDILFSMETLSQKNSIVELDIPIDINKSLLRCQKCQKYCLATFTRKKTPLAMKKHSYYVSKKKSKETIVIQKKISCQFCESIFDSQDNLVGHYKLNHPNWAKNIFWITCARCNKHFSDQEAIDDHKDGCLKAKSKSEYHICNICGEQTGSNRLIYNNHVRTVHPKEELTSWIKCYECDIRFPDFNSMVKHFLKKCSQHMKTRHNVENQATMKPQKSRRPRKPKIPKMDSQVILNVEQCQFCIKSFSNCRDMYKHARDVHTEKVSELWSKCPKCDKTYPDKIIVLKHQRTSMCQDGNNRIMTHVAQCQFCCNKNMVFMNCNQLYKHARDVHPEKVDELWSKCAKCGEAFPDKNIVEQHQLLPCKKLLVKNCYYCHKDMSAEEDEFKHAGTTDFEQALLSWKVCPTCIKHYPEECCNRRNVDIKEQNIELPDQDDVSDIDIKDEPIEWMVS